MKKKLKLPLLFLLLLTLSSTMVFLPSCKDKNTALNPDEIFSVEYVAKSEMSYFPSYSLTKLYASSTDWRNNYVKAVTSAELNGEATLSSDVEATYSVAGEYVEGNFALSNFSMSGNADSGHSVGDSVSYYLKDNVAYADMTVDDKPYKVKMDLAALSSVFTTLLSSQNNAMLTFFDIFNVYYDNNFEDDVMANYKESFLDAGAETFCIKISLPKEKLIEYSYMLNMGSYSSLLNYATINAFDIYYYFEGNCGSSWTLKACRTVQDLDYNYYDEATQKNCNYLYKLDATYMSYESEIVAPDLTQYTDVSEIA